MRRVPHLRVAPLHIDYILKNADLQPMQENARSIILSHFEFDPSGAEVGKKDLIACLMQANNFSSKRATNLLAEILVQQATTSRLVYGLRRKPGTVEVH